MSTHADPQTREQFVQDENACQNVERLNPHVCPDLCQLFLAYCPAFAPMPHRRSLAAAGAPSVETYTHCRRVISRLDAEQTNTCCFTCLWTPKRSVPFTMPLVHQHWLLTASRHASASADRTLSGQAAARGALDGNTFSNPGTLNGRSS